MEDPREQSTTLDILDWWKRNSKNYPILSNMARDILAIPISTVASKSAFNTGGRIISQHRTCLKSTTVEALVCAQDWLLVEEHGDGEYNDSDALDDLLNILKED